MAVQGKLIGLSPAQLQDIIAAGQQCIVANAVRGVSYSIAGRSFTFPSMTEAMDMMAEAQYAYGLVTGQRSNNCRANFNIAIGRGTSQYGGNLSNDPAVNPFGTGTPNT